MTTPTPNACRPTDGPDGTVEYVWTVATGEGIVHPHDPDGCPFEPGGRWAGQAEEVVRGAAGQPCATCGQLHDGPHA